MSARLEKKLINWIRARNKKVLDVKVLEDSLKKIQCCTCNGPEKSPYRRAVIQALKVLREGRKLLQMLERLEGEELSEN